MIVEGIVTTIGEDGLPHIAPMGPRTDPTIARLTLRPFKTSTTYKNLRRAREGVFHITDDVELLARAAVGRVEPPPAFAACATIATPRLAYTCRWFAFRVEEVDDGGERATFMATIVERGSIRDFLGFNRAKHAVLEGAILATRLHFLPRDEVLSEFRRLSVLVEKTAGEQERRAFDFLRRHVEDLASSGG